MPSLRTLTRRWLPLNIKRSFQHAILGYDSYAPSFSSAGEDMILRHILGSDKMSGFYVDVGAYDPVTYSNTYHLYNRGWRGINIDIVADRIEKFDKYRPEDKNVLDLMAERMRTLRGVGTKRLQRCDDEADGPDRGKPAQRFTVDQSPFYSEPRFGLSG